MHPSSRNYAPRLVSQRSRLVRLEDLRSKSPVPHNVPRVLPMTRLTGGRDGIDAITPEDFIGLDMGPGERCGLLALAANDEVAVLAVPDAMRFYDREPGPAGELKAQRIQDQMISICELQKDRFSILDIPQSKDIEWVRRWRRRTDSSFCAYYWPWLRATAMDEKPRILPPSGFLAGCYARRDLEGVHHSPANLEIEGVQDIALRITEDHSGLLNSTVNTFGFSAGSGVVHAPRHPIRSGAMFRSDVFSSCYAGRSRQVLRGSHSSRTTMSPGRSSAAGSASSWQVCTPRGCSPEGISRKPSS
jgi:hypothetical protein